MTTKEPIATPIVFISVLLLYKAYTAISAFRSQPVHLITAQAITAECVILLIASYFALRKQIVALWIMAISFWLQALFTSLMVIMPPQGNNWFRAMGFVLTINFVIGGLVMVKRHLGGTPNQAL